MEIFKYTDDCLLDVLINFADAYPRLYKKVNCRCCMEIKKYYPHVSRFLYEYFERYARAYQDKVEESVALGYVRRSISPHLVYNFFMENFEKLFMVEPDRVTGGRGLYETVDCRVCSGNSDGQRACLYR